MTPEQQADLKDTLEYLLAQGQYSDIAAIQVVVDEHAALQRENAALTTALQACQRTIVLRPPDFVEECLEIIDAALTPSAAPGEADCSICRQPGCTGGHACE